MLNGRAANYICGIISDEETGRVSAADKRPEAAKRLPKTTPDSPLLVFNPSIKPMPSSLNVAALRRQ